MHDCKQVDVDYFERAPHRFVAEIETPASPERIFDAFEDAHAWTVWAPPISSVEWTSPKPFGVGTTRTVGMIGNMVGEEVFIAWERGRRMAFCFARTSTPGMESFAEDYEVEPIDEGRTRVRWTMAMTPTGANAIGLKLAGPVMGWTLQWMLNRFGRYLERG